MEDELDKIIMNMVSAGESEDNIALVINSYNSEKKKSGATATPPNSASGTPIGSSGGKGFPKIDTNSVAPGSGVQPVAETNLAKEKRLRKELASVKVTPKNMDQVMADTDALSLSIKQNEQAFKEAKSKRVKELEGSFYAATKNDSDDAKADKRLNDKLNNNGFVNNVVSASKSVFNTVLGAVSASNPNLTGLASMGVSEDPLADEKKEARKEAIKNKQSLSDDEINERAKVIFKEKEKDNLFLDRANSFLDNLDVEDKDLLKQNRYDKAIHLQEDNIKKLAVSDAMQVVAEEKIKDYKSIESQLKALQDKNQAFPEDLYNQYTTLGTEIQQIGGNIKKYQDQIQKNKSDLGTAKQEFDLFKRGYGDFDNFAGNLTAGIGELAVNTLAGLEYVGTLGGNLGDKEKIKGVQKDFSIATGVLEEARGNLRTPVRAIESPEGFVNYMSDLVANQIPSLIATSTGTKGLAAIGVSGAGATSINMNEEVSQGKASYSPLQMIAVPFLNGGFEVISEIPTLSILKKGGRVMEAVAKNEIDLIKKSGKEVFKGYAVDFGKELGGENITNLGQNFTAKYVQGKKDVNLLDNTGAVSKDTAFLTILLQGSPHVFGAVVKPFQSPSDLGVLDENSRKIVEFSKQLKNESLTDTERAIIEKQVAKVTAKSAIIVANTIKKIGDMPMVLHTEIVSLNAQAGELKSQAKEIKEGKLPNKAELLKGLGEDYKALQQKRQGIISGNVTAVDVLPLKEQDKLKREALKELTVEQNPDGTKNIEIDNGQILERANKNYKASEKLQAENKLKEQEKVAESNNSQISNPTDSNVLPTETAENQDASQIKEPVAEVSPVPSVSEVEGVSKVVKENFYSQEEIDSHNEKYDKEYDEISERLEKEYLAQGLSKSEAFEQMNKNPELIQNAKEQAKLEAHNNTLFKEVLNEVINNKLEIPKYFNNEERQKQIENSIKKSLSKRFSIDDADFNSVRNHQDLLTEVELTKISKTLAKDFLPDGMNFTDLTSDQKSQALEKIAPIVESFRKLLSAEIIDKQGINEGTSRNNITPDGNLPLGANNVGENGITKSETPIAESVPSSVYGGEVKGDAEVSDLDHAKSQIDKGVLNWNGDTGAERINLGITWPDIRKGEKDIKAGKINTVPAKRLIEALKTAKENGGYEYKQGSGNQIQKQFVSLEDIQRATNEYELTDSEQKEVDAIELELSNEYELYFEGLDLETQNDIYENKEGIDGMGEEVASIGESKNDVSNKENEENSGAKEKTALEKAQEIRRAAKAKLVAKRQNLAIASNPQQDAQDLVDYHKALVNEAKEHIKIGVASLADFAKAIGEKISVSLKNAWQDANGEIDTITKAEDLDYDFDTVDDEVPAPDNKESDKDFKEKPGVSSILKRLRDGGNDASTNAIIDEVGLNYEKRKQSQVYADGVNFVKDVGIAEAYNAIKNGEIKHSDSINVIYNEILQQFPKFAEAEISKVTDADKLNALVKEMDDFHQKIYTEFASRNTDAGQGTSMLNYIINQDQKIRYSLAQQVKKFKSVNNGVVPSEILEKMKELEKRYSEANDRIEQLEGLLKEAKEQKDFENIITEQKREPKQSKSKREKAEKIIKALDDFEKSILKNSYSDVTMVTPILIQGIRAAKLAVKANVEISEAIEKAIEGIKKELAKLGKTFEDEERFRAGLNNALESNGIDTKQPKVTVDKTGKVKIPTEMIKEFISNGGTDLSEFATQVHKSIKDEFPDVTVREIRESVANYGKKANKSKAQITTDIQKLKSEERLRLEYEDLQNRISKEKNEIKKQKLSQTQKRLKEQIKQLQDDLGVTETERTNRSVNYTKKRIEILRDKIKNNDFAKKEIKPIVESQELKEARIEKNRVQEEFDYLSYKQELENRSFGDKALALGKDLYDSQRVTLATGELSFVGAQGAFYMVDSTISRATLKNLVENFKGTTVKDWKSNPFGTAMKMVKSAHSATALIKMFNTMGTANNYMDFQRLLKEDPNFDVYLKSGLRLLGEDVKTQVQDDNFYGNHIINLLRIPIHLTDRIEKKELLKFKLSLAEEAKKRTTIQGYYEKLKTGKVSDKNKKTATEIFDNANPLSTFERGNNTFMNMARIELFNKYAAELYSSGKNPIDHIDDFKKLASAVNTITGSGNMPNKLKTALPTLSWIMFSARYFAASWNIMSPMSVVYLAKLGNYDGMEINKPSTWATWKPTVAQKAFVKPMVKGVLTMYGITLATTAMINAAIDDDDEMTEEEKAKKRAYIEYDPRSSNFMQVNSGNSHTDFFGPYRGNLVLLAKIWTRETKNSKGEIVKNGTGFGSRTNRDIIFDYAAGKANPALGVLLRNAQGSEKEVLNEETGIKEIKLMYYDDDVSFRYQIKHNTYPIFVKTVQDVLKEDPVLGATFYNTMAFLGKNTNIYKTKAKATFEDKFLKDQAKKKALFELPQSEKDKITVDNKLTRAESEINKIKSIKLAQQRNLPYYISQNASLTKEEVAEIDLTGSDEAIAEVIKIIEAQRKEYGIEDEE